MRLEHLLSGDTSVLVTGTGSFRLCLGFLLLVLFIGGLAQLARALAWHARGHRFDPDILHMFAVSYLTYSTYVRHSTEIFDILRHKTVSEERLFVLRKKLSSAQA